MEVAHGNGDLAPGWRSTGHVAARNKPLLRGLLRALIVVVLVLVAALAAMSKGLHQLPWQAGPDRIHVCNRDFLGPGYHYTLKEVVASGSAPIAQVTTLRGGLAIWGRHVTLGGVAGCGTGVYLQTSTDGFRGYALAGGP